ncbi:MAG: hypothetical protein F6K48_32480, partial [Okeania sp. SIO3H1]|nr:hypothetical protein [Okeania sp. SIO3H1]
GLNAIVPIPAATLTPVFLAAGLAPLGIILALVVGTVIADALGFLLGRSTKELVEEHYPRLTQYLTRLTTANRVWLFLFIVGYAAFVPFPNEAMLIPLAFSGIKFRYVLTPLLLGNLLHQLILVYGITELISWFS